VHDDPETIDASPAHLAIAAQIFTIAWHLPILKRPVVAPHHVLAGVFFCQVVRLMTVNT
jgi:hypothetical protein